MAQALMIDAAQALDAPGWGGIPLYKLAEDYTEGPDKLPLRYVAAYLTAGATGKDATPLTAAAVQYVAVQRASLMPIWNKETGTTVAETYADGQAEFAGRRPHLTAANATFRLHSPADGPQSGPLSPRTPPQPARAPPRAFPPRAAPITLRACERPRHGRLVGPFFGVARCALGIAPRTARACGLRRPCYHQPNVAGRPMGVQTVAGDLGEQLAELRGAVLSKLESQDKTSERLETKLDHLINSQEQLRSRQDDHERRIVALEKGRSSDQSARRTFWGRALQIAMVASGYVLSFWHPWSRTG